MPEFSNTEAVIDYYNQCHIDYRILWRSHRNLCIHYGYFDEEHDTHAAALPNMNRVVAEHAGITEKDTVLDAGCGVGGSSMWLAENRGAKVCGINIQPLHLKLAKEEATRRGLNDPVRFEKHNYCETSLDPESFDVVWALESLCHSDRKSDFMAEAFRLLKPGGRLVVADFFQYKKTLDPEETKRMRCWLEGWALPDLAEVDEFTADLNDTGFEDVASDDITSNVMRSARRIWKASLIILPLTTPLEILRFRTKRQNANVLAARHQYLTIRDGLWGYSIFTAKKPSA